MYVFWSTQYKDIYSNTITLKNWKQHRCPSVENWLNMLTYIHTVKCFMAIKKAEEDSYVKKKQRQVQNKQLLFL